MHRKTIGKLPVFADYPFEKFICAIVEDWDEIPPSLCLPNRDRIDRNLSPEQKQKNKTERIWLPGRYAGGLLFGQRIPRFENRIISDCRKTGTKTPLKQCREFYEYRWAMLVNDINVGNQVDKEKKLLLDPRPLDIKERNALDAKMRARGFSTRAELTAAVKEISHCKENNLDRMFTDTPEREESLVLQPVDKYLANKTELAHYLFPILPAKLQRNLRNGLWRGKRYNLEKDVLPKIEDDAETKQKCAEAIDAYIREKAKHSEDEEVKADIVSLDGESATDATEPRKRKRTKPLKREEVLKESLYARPAPLTGRAPYCREILIQAKKEIFGDGFGAAYDPRRYSAKKLKLERASLSRLENAEDKYAHGCLAGTEEVSAETLGIGIDDEQREAAFQKWRADWIKKLNQNGEDLNRRRAEKYGEAWVRRQYETQELEKWLAKKTNNHLVRQRMLIIDRLTQDIIAEFADGDPKRIGRIAIEVARDLVTFSGMTSKQRGGDDNGVMGSIRAQHRRVTKWLKQQLGDSHKHLINGKTIWLAKVAEDLNYRDPYLATHPKFCPLKLARGEYQVDHIIPKSVRLTNAMEAVVLTTPEINSRKSKMTSLQFIREMNKPENLAERDRLGICSVKSYLDFVASLKTHQTKGDSNEKAEDDAGDEGDGKSSDKINPKYLPGSQRLHPDCKRRKRRKFYLLRPEYNKDNDAFTSRQLTNTSYLNRLAKDVLLRRLPHLGEENAVSIPGQVTKALRDSRGWNLFICLGHRDVCGNAATREVSCLDKSTRLPLKDNNGDEIKKRVPLPKEELRKLTHLHHAVDACALGLIAHWLPKHGKLWELLALGELTEKEKAEYDSIVDQFARGELRTPMGRQKVKEFDLSQFLTCYKIDDTKTKRSPDPERVYRLEAKRTPDAKARMCWVRDQISRELAKKRVVQHIPTEHAGLPTDETIYRVITGVAGNGKVIRLVREQIEKQRRKMTELEKPFREWEAKLESFDREIESIADGKLRSAAKKERQAQRKPIAKAVQDAKAKYEAAKSLLETMENFQTNAWLVKKVRAGSDGWEKLKKQFEKIAAGQSASAEATEAGDDGSGDANENQKATKLPKLLRKLDLEKDKVAHIFEVVSRAKLVGQKTIASNFGIAILDNVPNEREKCVVIPWHKVWPRIYGPNPVNGEQPLIDRNGGQRPRILRNGQLIRVPKGTHQGTWRVFSAKNNADGIALALGKPDAIAYDKAKQNVKLRQLLKDGMVALNTSLVGVAACPTTSSA